MDTYEAVVVGAGMFGAAAGRYLSEAGARTLIVGPAEPGPDSPVSQYAFGAYFDEARITRRLGWDEVWGTTDSMSLQRFADIEAATGLSFFHDCGSLVVMANSIAHRTNAILEQCVADGIAVGRLSADALQKRFPQLGLPPMIGGVEGLLESQQAGYINPRTLVQAELKLAELAGGELVRAAVTNVEKVDGLWLVHTQNGDQYRAEKVLLATGAFTNYNNVLPPGCHLALHCFTEPNLLFEVASDQLEQMQALPTVVTVDPDDTGDKNTSLYMVPPIRYPDGKWYMRLGPGMQPIVEELTTAEQMTAWYAAQTITPRQMTFLSEMMQMLVPDLKPASVRQAGCIIEKTPSRYPYIGAVNEDETLTVAVGGNGHGARGCDEIGRIAATVVLDQAWDSRLDRNIFTPQFGDPDAIVSDERPEFLKPPFGLC